MTLLVTKLYAFACDAAGCEQVGEDIMVATKGGARSAWGIAAESGWTRCDDQHYCPEHGRENRTHVQHSVGGGRPDR